MKNCIFCKIAKKEIPADILYEDDNFLGFLDTYPASCGHTLLIPKKHYRWVHEVEPFSRYWGIAREIMYTLDKALSPVWIQYFTHGVVPHAHIHIIPRYDDIEQAEALLQQSTDPESKRALEMVAKKIRNF